MVTLSRAARRVGRVLRETSALPDKRRALSRWAAFELMRTVTPVAAVDTDGLRFFVSTRDRSLGRIVYMCGGYEPEMIAGVVQRLHGELGPGCLEGRTVIDVGANIGTSIVPLLAQYGAATGLALEPEPANFALLEVNVAANGLTGRIRCRRIAASDHAGAAQLELSPGNSGDHRIRTATAVTSVDDAYGEAGRRAISVAVRPLDDVLEQEQVAASDVGLLWVDTQGHEGQVLAGAERLLSAGVPTCIEYWPYGLRRADGLELLHRTVAKHFGRVIDLRAAASGGRDELEAADIERFAESYPEERYTDLLLLPG